jgi:hypothetical protein
MVELTMPPTIGAAIRFITSALAGCGKTISTQQNFDGLHVWGKRRPPL